MLARACVFLECAHYVHRCNRGDWPVWIKQLAQTPSSGFSAIPSIALTPNLSECFPGIPSLGGAAGGLGPGLTAGMTLWRTGCWAQVIHMALSGLAGMGQQGKELVAIYRKQKALMYRLLAALLFKSWIEVCSFISIPLFSP